MSQGRSKNSEIMTCSILNDHQTAHVFFFIPAKLRYLVLLICEAGRKCSEHK